MGFLYIYIHIYIYTCISAKSLQSCLTLATLWTVAYQAPLPMGFSRQEYWSGLPCPPPGDLPNPGAILTSLAAPALQAVSLLLSHQESPCVCVCVCVYWYFILLYIPLYMNILLEKVSIIFISLSVCDSHQSLKKLLVSDTKVLISPNYHIYILAKTIISFILYLWKLFILYYFYLFPWKRQP